ncbi:MAG: hypothetical protein ACLRZ9_09740 [Eubacterium sp.]
MENNIGLTNKQKALSIYKWTLRKYLPFSIAYWILLFMTFPMIEILGMIICSQYKASQLYGMTKMEYYIDGVGDLGEYLPGTFFAAVVILFSTILAIMAFSYMHNKRAVDFFGSFPVSRRTLFFSRFMAVMTASIIPMLVFGTMGALLTLSDVVMIKVFKVIGIILLGIIGNVSFIAFISLCCGTVVDVIISYVVISAVYPISVVLCYTFPKSIIPGLSEGYLPNSVFTLFCPVAAPFVAAFSTEKALHIAWWIILSVLLVVSCSILCKKRKAETAQNAFAFAAVEIVIKFIACFTAGIGAGWVFSYLGQEYDSVKAQYLWFVIGLILGIMVANILLHLIFHRGLSKYKKSLVECGAIFAVSMVFLVIIVTGAFGYDMRTPDVDDIKEVSVRTGVFQTFTVDGKDIFETYSNDKTVIKDAVNLHDQITDELKKSKHSGFYPIIYNTYGAGISMALYDGNYYANAVRIVYKLKNGSTMKRTFYVSTEKLNISKTLTNITTDDEQILQTIPVSYTDCIDLQKMRNGEKGEQTCVAEVSLWNGEENWDKAKIQKVITALKKDVKEKGISKESNSAYDVSISYYNNSTDESAACNIKIPKTFDNTIKALEETGYANVGYYELKDNDGEYDYVSSQNIKLIDTRTIYFKVPESWDKEAAIQCMPYRIEMDETEEYDYRMTVIDDQVTQCENVSGNIWKYTIRVPEDRSVDDYNAVMFYQIAKNDTRTTGIIRLPQNAKKNLLTIENIPDVNDPEFWISELENFCDYNWTAYKNK